MEENAQSQGDADLDEKLDAYADTTGKCTHVQIEGQGNGNKRRLVILSVSFLSS